MGQVLSAMQAYTNVIWTVFTGPPRPALAGVVSPKIKALMDGYKGAPRQVPTSACFKQLQKVKNMRDLAEVCPNIAPGRILRSACPTAASEQDIDIIRHKLGISHLVDLRSEFERSEDPASPLVAEAELRVSKRQGSIAQMERFEQRDSQHPNSVNAPLIIHHLSLLERSRYYKAILLKIPFATSAYALAWMPFNPSKGKSAIMAEVNRGGLPMLYEILLEIAGPELKCALEVITEAAEAGEPLLFFCRVGKDRTGVLAALILSCCGAKPEEIIADYHRSDSVVSEIALGGLEKEDKELHQLDRAVFSKAPAEVMAATLTHLDEMYGGPSRYLESIGFSREQQQRLAKAVSASRDHKVNL
ncbi:hypothetical protein ABBQ38_012875 [Trebouxia sp. C0009 RCD-2024]